MQELHIAENGTDRFTVNKEVSEEYRSSIDNNLHNDPIDIHIVDKAQKNSWGEITKPYFAIECKRIKSGITEYIKDTQKFTERNYQKLRLPFEGQLGFIENHCLTHSKIQDQINKKLSSHNIIETIALLEHYPIKDKFEGSFFSEHLKNNKSHFTIFHLFFNYSQIIQN